MALSNRMKVHTLVTRELQEYRTSLLITPAVVGAALLLMMLASVIFAGRLAMLGSGWMNVLEGNEGGGFVIEVNIDEDEEIVVDADGNPVDPRLALPEEPLQELVIEEGPADIDEEVWNFSQEWTFSPPGRQTRSQGDEVEVDTLNPILNGINSLFLFIMMIVSVNFLLGTLYQDRKDRSILFWKSMPVSEWEEVLCKLAVASLIVPLVFLGISLVTQMFSILLAMLMVWRMDGAPMELVLGNVQFVPLVLNQLSGSVIWALFTLPAYAWFMICGAAAKRSPFMLAFFIPAGLVFIERVFIGTHFVLGSIGAHAPRHIDGNDAASLGFYKYGPEWASLDYLSMLMGFGFAALAIYGAVWLRRYRFET